MANLDFMSVVSMIALIGTLWCRSTWIILTAFIFFSTVSLLSGWIEPAFIASTILLLAVSIWARNATGKISLSLAYISLIIVALALGVHVLPGFNSILLMEDTQITENTGWDSLRFIADKPMVGVILLAVLFRDQLIRRFDELFRAIRQSLPFTLAGIAVVYLVALASGYVRFDWSPSIVISLWLIRNLFFTVVAEEVLFRGVIMSSLAKWWTFKFGKWLALVVSSILFGLAHIAGGIEYVLIASLAGIVYGYAMMRTGRIEMAMLAHLLLNTGHILFFSY